MSTEQSRDTQTLTTDGPANAFLFLFYPLTDRSRNPTDPIDTRGALSHLEMLCAEMTNRDAVPFCAGMKLASTNLGVRLQSGTPLFAADVLLQQRFLTKGLFQVHAEKYYNFDRAHDPDPFTQVSPLKLFNIVYDNYQFFRGYCTAMTRFWEDALHTSCNPFDIRRFARLVLLEIPDSKNKKAWFGNRKRT